MQPPPECFPLPLISLLFWVDTEIVSCSYGLQSLAKCDPPSLTQLRACRSPKLVTQLIGQKPVLRREFRAESDSFRQGCGALFCSRRFCLSYIGRRYIHSGPLNHIVASRPIPRLCQLSNRHWFVLSSPRPYWCFLCRRWEKS